MTLRIVRLGSSRAPGEGPRLGTVRRPPRGVPREEFSSRDFYDVWLPQLSPSADLVAGAQKATTAADWSRFVKSFRREMAEPDCQRLLDLLALLSRTSNFSLGCYCEEESKCHRSVLRQLLQERGADLQPPARPG